MSKKNTQDEINCFNRALLICKDHLNKTIQHRPNEIKDNEPYSIFSFYLKDEEWANEISNKLRNLGTFVISQNNCHHIITYQPRIWWSIGDILLSNLMDTFTHQLFQLTDYNEWYLNWRKGKFFHMANVHNQTVIGGQLNDYLSSIEYRLKTVDTNDFRNNKLETNIHTKINEWSYHLSRLTNVSEIIINKELKPFSEKLLTMPLRCISYEIFEMLKILGKRENAITGTERQILQLRSEFEIARPSDNGGGCIGERANIELRMILNNLGINDLEILHTITTLDNDQSEKHKNWRTEIYKITENHKNTKKDFRCTLIEQITNSIEIIRNNTIIYNLDNLLCRESEKLIYSGYQGVVNNVEQILKNKKLYNT